MCIAYTFTMPTFEIFALLIGALGVWFWLDGARAREIAVRAAADACVEDGFQFLDETVVLRRLRLIRDDGGRLCVLREYSFEFSDTGNNRQGGRVSLLGQEIEMLHLRPRLQLVTRQLPEEGDH